MSTPPRPRLSREELAEFMQLRPMLSVAKFSWFVTLMVLLTWVAWESESIYVDWPAYLALGYLWMSVVTFMHDATHDSLFPRRWQNQVFGTLAMLPLMVSFIAFKEDHLKHHRFNRSPMDPDAFTMGRRGVADFAVFYLYFFIGGLLTALHFTLIYPVKAFGPKQWAIHLFENALKIACYVTLVMWARTHDLLGEVLAVWLFPLLFFSLFNSFRFIAEHYQTPWNRGNLMGTRTITSNRLHSYFWNNINWHIGHHVYPKVPWYNLVELHGRLEPEIEALGAVVDRSYTSVCWNAFVKGPESEARLALIHPPAGSRKDLATPAPRLDVPGALAKA